MAMARSFGRNTSADPLNYGITPNSRNLVSATLSGKYLNPETNPYFQKALAAGFAPQNEAFNNTILPGLRAQFEGSGRNLGGADFDTAMRATKDLNQTQANAAATAGGNFYAGERANQNTALGLLPGMNAMDLQTQQAELIPGTMKDAKTQQNIDAAMAKYNYEKTAQTDWLTKMAQQLQAIYPGGTTSGSGTSFSTGTPSSNPTASMLGAGLGAAGTFAQFLPFLPFSDKRLKEDIKPVGKTFDGQNIYSYRFLGEPRHQIGLMAQEVEERDPDAVVTDSRGWKHVDYGRATARATPAGGLL